MKDENNHNLFQQIGTIQGTLTALNANISDFKTELRSLTSDQNRRIDELRKEITDDLKTVNENYNLLEQKKLDKAEATRLQNESDKILATFASKEDVALIKRIVYGAVSLILVAFMGVIIATVFK